MYFTSVKNDELKTIRISEISKSGGHLYHIKWGKNSSLIVSCPPVRLIKQCHPKNSLFEFELIESSDKNKFIKWCDKVCKMLAWNLYTKSEELFGELYEMDMINNRLMQPIVDNSMIVFQLHDGKKCNHNRLLTAIVDSDGKAVTDKLTLKNFFELYKGTIFKPDILFERIKIGSLVKVYISPLQLKIIKDPVKKVIDDQDSKQPLLDLPSLSSDEEESDEED